MSSTHCAVCGTREEQGIPHWPYCLKVNGDFISGVSPLVRYRAQAAARLAEDVAPRAHARNVLRVCRRIHCGLIVPGRNRATTRPGGKSAVPVPVLVCAVCAPAPANTPVLRRTCGRCG